MPLNRDIVSNILGFMKARFKMQHLSEETYNELKGIKISNHFSKAISNQFSKALKYPTTHQVDDISVLDMPHSNMRTA